MSEKQACVRFLNEAISIIEEMKDMVSGQNPDSAQAFLEFSMDAQDQISKAVLEALKPLLKLEMEGGNHQ